MAPTPALQIQRLRIEIQGGSMSRDAVTDLDLELFPARVLGLVGESGCGKSLTCRAVFNLLPHGIKQTRGEIRIFGQRTDSLPNRQIRKIRGRRVAFILQHPMSALNPLLTIRRHFQETADAHGARFTEWGAVNILSDLAFSDPEKILGMHPHQLSGGMQQRVVIGLSLVHEAPLLIADEPTTALDTTTQALILNLLSSQQKRLRTAILLVTHDLSVIARMADDVAVMKNGRLVETGTVQDVFQNPRHPYTQNLLLAHRALHGIQ